MNLPANKMLAQAYRHELGSLDGLGDALRDGLREGLRRSYDPTFREPLPRDWLQLIDDLEAKLSAPTTRSFSERLRQALRLVT